MKGYIPTLPTRADTIYFKISVSGGVRLYLSNQLLIDELSNTTAQTFTTTYIYKPTSDTVWCYTFGNNIELELIGSLNFSLSYSTDGTTYTDLPITEMVPNSVRQSNSLLEGIRHFATWQNGYYGWNYSGTMSDVSTDNLSIMSQGSIEPDKFKDADIYIVNNNDSNYTNYLTRTLPSSKNLSINGFIKIPYLDSNNSGIDLLDSDGTVVLSLGFEPDYSWRSLKFYVNGVLNYTDGLNNSALRLGNNVNFYTVLNNGYKFEIKKNGDKVQLVLNRMIVASTTLTSGSTLASIKFKMNVANAEYWIKDLIVIK